MLFVQDKVKKYSLNNVNNNNGKSISIKRLLPYSPTYNIKFKMFKINSIN